MNAGNKIYQFTRYYNGEDYNLIPIDVGFLYSPVIENSVVERKKLKNISRVGVISPIGPYFHADGTCRLRHCIRRKDVNVTSFRVPRRWIEGLSDGTIARGIRIVTTSP